MRAVIYARVRTSTQDYQGQPDNLRDYASRLANTIKETDEPGKDGVQREPGKL